MARRYHALVEHAMAAPGGAGAPAAFSAPQLRGLVETMELKQEQLRRCQRRLVAAWDESPVARPGAKSRKETQLRVLRRIKHAR